VIAFEGRVEASKRSGIET